jgi:hypothetical protein
LSKITAYCCDVEVWSGVGREPPPAKRNGKNYPVKAGEYLTELREDGKYGPDPSKSGRSGVFDLAKDPPDFQAIQLHAIPRPKPIQPDPNSPNKIQSSNDINLSNLPENNGQGCTWGGKCFEISKGEDGELDLNLRDAQIALRELRSAYEKCCPSGGQFPLKYIDAIGEEQIPTAIAPNVTAEDLNGGQIDGIPTFPRFNR